MFCFLCLGVSIDVSAVTHFCRCVACFMPEIVLGLPIFFEVRPSAVIFRPAFPSLVLRCEEAGVENCLFSECDEFLVGFLLGHEVRKNGSVSDLLDEEGNVICDVPWAAHAFVILRDVVGRWAAEFRVEAIVESHERPVRCADEHVGELGSELGVELGLGDRDKCLVCVDHLVIQLLVFLPLNGNNSVLLLCTVRVIRWYKGLT